MGCALGEFSIVFCFVWTLIFCGQCFFFVCLFAFQSSSRFLIQPVLDMGVYLVETIHHQSTENLQETGLFERWMLTDR
jgi:hypothetical protein